MFAKYSMHSGNLKLIFNINFVVDARMYPEVHTFFFVNDLGPVFQTELDDISLTD